MLDGLFEMDANIFHSLLFVLLLQIDMVLVFSKHAPR